MTVITQHWARISQCVLYGDQPPADHRPLRLHRGDRFTCCGTLAPPRRRALRRMPRRACSWTWDYPGIGGVDDLGGDPGWTARCRQPATHVVKATELDPWEPASAPRYRSELCQEHALGLCAQDSTVRAYRFRRVPR